MHADENAAARARGSLISSLSQPVSGRGAESVSPRLPNAVGPLLLFLVALSTAFGCRRAETESPVPPPSETWLTDAQIRGARLAIEPVARRPLDRHLVTPGRVGFDESRVAHVFSPVNGRVTRVLAGFGASVRRGDALAEIESPDLGSAWSDALKARADLVAADHELDRQKALFAADATARRDLETAEDAEAKAKAELDRTEWHLRTLHAEGSRPTQEFLLRAPLSGRIVNRTATPGLEVQGMQSSANVVQELFTVGDIDRVWVWGDLYERDLGRVRAGQKVAISSVAWPGRTISGVVDFVGETLDKDTHTAKIRCTVENADRRLEPEMYVTMAIETDRREALAIPQTAVVRSGERRVVYVEDGRTADHRVRFIERAVEVGDADGGLVEVASGLAAGERVVVSGSILLSGGGS